MVYATCPQGPIEVDSDVDRLRLEMREKILNVFRICHLHGHD